MQALNARMLAGEPLTVEEWAGVGTLEPPSSPALLVVLFWVEEEEKEEEEEEDETDESKAVDVLWVPVQLLFLTSLAILFFSFPLFGVWVWRTFVYFSGRQLPYLLSYSASLGSDSGCMYEFGWSFSTAPCTWQFVRCCCLRSACVDSSGRRLLEGFRTQRLLGRHVDTCYCQSTEAFVRISYFFLRGLPRILSSVLVLLSAWFCGLPRRVQEIGFFWCPRQVVCPGLVLLVSTHFALCFLLCFQALMPCIMAGMDQKDIFCGSAVAVCLGRCHPCRCAEFIPWSRQFVRPGIPKLLHMVVDVPVQRSHRSSSSLS